MLVKHDLSNSVVVVLFPDPTYVQFLMIGARVAEPDQPSITVRKPPGLFPGEQGVELAGRQPVRVLAISQPSRRARSTTLTIPPAPTDVSPLSLRAAAPPEHG